MRWIWSIPWTTRATTSFRLCSRRLDVQQQQIRSRTSELKRRQADFSAVTDNMGEGLVLLGREDAVLSINPAACRLLECTATTGRDILEVNRSPELRSVLAQAHKGKRAEELMSIRGRRYRLEGTPVESSGGVRGVVLLFQDVTEREQAGAHPAGSSPPTCPMN